MSKTNKELYFKLFNQVFVVKGASRNLIFDTQRGDMFEISNPLYELVQQSESKSISELSKFIKATEEVVLQAFAFLTDKDLGLITDRRELLAPVSTQFESPNIIEDCIIEADFMTLGNVDRIIKGLKDLRVRFLELRFYKELNLDILQSFMSQIEETYVRGIVCYAKYDRSNQNLDLDTYPHIQKMIFHSCEDMEDDTPRIMHIRQEISSNSCCGNIGKFNMENKFMVFLEALNFNSCLNRKIAIDINGQIKNCPSMKASFGHIEDTSMKEAVGNPDFKKYWNLTKDSIQTCRDCEFRYVCTDCRAFVEDPSDIQSKPLKCGYNPYSGQWSEWSTNPLKQKAIAYYGIAVNQNHPQNA